MATAKIANVNEARKGLLAALTDFEQGEAELVRRKAAVAALQDEIREAEEDRDAARREIFSSLRVFLESVA